MKITILCVGKIKESFYREAVEEYAKRLSRYCKLEILETADEKTPEGASPLLEEQIRQREGERLLEKIRPDAFVITLEIGGKRCSSEAFAAYLDRCFTGGKSHLVFVIGGSLGLSREVRERSDCALSFSDLTFPHQLMRVILCEQIYRAFRILHGEPYHK